MYMKIYKNCYQKKRAAYIYFLLYPNDLYTYYTHKTLFLQCSRQINVSYSGLYKRSVCGSQKLKLKIVRFCQNFWDPSVHGQGLSQMLLLLIMKSREIWFEQSSVYKDFVPDPDTCKILHYLSLKQPWQRNWDFRNIFRIFLGWCQDLVGEFPHGVQICVQGLHLERPGIRAHSFRYTGIGIGRDIHRYW